MLLLAKCFHIHYLIYFSIPLTFHLITHRKRKQVSERLTFTSSKWLNQSPNIGIPAPNKAFYLTTGFAVLDVIVIGFLRHFQRLWNPWIIKSRLLSKILGAPAFTSVLLRLCAPSPTLYSSRTRFLTLPSTPRGVHASAGMKLGSHRSPKLKGFSLLLSPTFCQMLEPDPSGQNATPFLGISPFPGRLRISRSMCVYSKCLVILIWVKWILVLLLWEPFQRSLNSACRFIEVERQVPSRGQVMGPEPHCSLEAESVEWHTWT